MEILLERRGTDILFIMKKTTVRRSSKMGGWIFAGFNFILHGELADAIFDCDWRIVSRVI